MRRQRGLVRLVGLATLVGLGIAAKPAVATVTTERSASILVFPKVIADGTRDTIIQITNTSNNMRHAHCFYVNGALTDPSAPQSDLNPPLWTETDFDIWLTKQQPTHWVASTGRLLNPADATCRSTTCDPSSSGGDHADCCDAGQDPGHVPPVGPDFTGELKCIETEATDMPVSGNSLKGEATIVESATNDVSKYNAIGLQGFDTNTGDGVLCIGGDVSDACPRGAEYAACPDTWMLDHPLVGSEDPVVAQADCGEGTCTSSVSANLTVVPCSEDFEHQSPPPVLLSFLVTNEFEQTFSSSTTFQCWQSFNLEDISNSFTSAIGGSVAVSRVRSHAVDPSRPAFGIMAVLEETHVLTDTQEGTITLTARAAENGHVSFTDQTGQDLLIIPDEQAGGPTGP
jgi:hypothetical protein